MQFKEVSFPDALSPTPFPEDITLKLPENTTLPRSEQHYLLYIPWEEKYLERIPAEFRDFFQRCTSLSSYQNNRCPYRCVFRIS